MGAGRQPGAQFGSRFFSSLRAPPPLGLFRGSRSILGFGMLAASVGQLSALKNSRQSRSQTMAMYLAEQQLEAFQSMSSADVIAALGDPAYPNDPNNPLDPDPGDDEVVE